MVSLSRFAAVAALVVSLIGSSSWRGAPVHAQNRPGDILIAEPAWDAIRTGRLQEAAEAFRQAIARSPRDPMLHLGAGLAAHLLGQPADARQALEEALRLNPRLTEAALLLGEIEYRQGEVLAAIGTYEAALAFAPDNARIRERLARWQRESELHDRFDQRISDNFTILFEGAREEALAERALQVLEAAYWRISTSLLIVPPGPITVVLYTERQFQDVTRSPAWAAAAFDGKIRLPVRGALEQPDELQRVLTHELTHALIWAVAPRGVPFWLNEGLAVVCEGDTMHSLAPGGAMTTGRVSLGALAGSFKDLSPDQAEAAYAQSAAAAGALLDLIGPTGVSTLLADIGSGTSFDRAFAERAPISFAAFQERLVTPAY